MKFEDISQRVAAAKKEGAETVLVLGLGFVGTAVAANLARTQKNGKRTFFVNQAGDVLSSRNNVTRYNGTVNVPSGLAAVLAGVGAPTMASTVAANATGQDGERWIVVN